MVSDIQEAKLFWLNRLISQILSGDQLNSVTCPKLRNNCLLNDYVLSERNYNYYKTYKDIKNHVSVSARETLPVGANIEIQCKKLTSMLLGGKDGNLNPIRQAFRKDRLEFWDTRKCSYPQAAFFPLWGSLGSVLRVFQLTESSLLR